MSELNDLLAGECEDEGTRDSVNAKPAGNPETGPGEVQDYDAWNHIPGGDELAGYAWDAVEGLHGNV